MGTALAAPKPTTNSRAPCSRRDAIGAIFRGSSDAPSPTASALPVAVCVEPATYSCAAHCATNPGSSCVGGDCPCDPGITDFVLTYDAATGHCVDATGGCDDVTAFCRGGATCLKLTRGEPWLPLPGGATAGGACECDPAFEANAPPDQKVCGQGTCFDLGAFGLPATPPVCTD